MPGAEELEKKKNNEEQPLPENLEETPFKPLPAEEAERIQQEDDQMVAEELPKLRAQIEQAFSGEKGTEQKETEPKKFSEAQNLEELFLLVEERKTVQGTEKEYTSREIEDILKRAEKLNISHDERKNILRELPRTDGLRERATGLLQIPKLYPETQVKAKDETRSPGRIEKEIYDISDLNSLRELYTFLDAEGYMVGNTGREYSAQYLKKTIEEVRAEVLGQVTSKTGNKRTPEKVRAVLEKSDILKRITTAGGLQKKVAELLIKEGE